MNRKLKLVLALSAMLAPSLAQTSLAADWKVTQTGENFDGVWSGGPRDNLVGGGVAGLSGGADNGDIRYTGPLASGAPMFAHLSGGGDDMTIAYSVAPSGTRPMELATVGRATGAR